MVEDAEGIAAGKTKKLAIADGKCASSKRRMSSSEELRADLTLLCCDVFPSQYLCEAGVSQVLANCSLLVRDAQPFSLLLHTTLDTFSSVPVL
jgi:hypothetical protein